MTDAKKYIFMITMFFFGILLFSFASNLFLKKAGFSKKVFLKPKPFQMTLEKNYVKAFRPLEKEMRKPPVEQLNASRNIFREIKEVKHQPLFILQSVKRKKIPIVFKGSIVRGDEVVIAQINWGNKTYFKKPNEAIKGWNLLDITREQVIIQSPAGERIILRLNEISHSKELTATILLTQTNQVYQVSLSDRIAGYEVLEISQENVILSNENSEISIKID